MESKQPAKPHHIAIIVTLMLAVYLSFTRLIWVQGHSVNASLALALPVGQLQTNDLVLLEYNHPMFDNGNKLVKIIKRIKCIPGEHLIIEKQNIFCEGVFLGVAKTHRKNGDPFPQFTFDGIIPENKYFLFGDSADSFDSRYFGLIDKSELIYYAKEVF